MHDDVVRDGIPERWRDAAQFLSTAIILGHEMMGYDADEFSGTLAREGAMMCWWGCVIFR
jgi:hypothetical protein